LSNRRFTLSLFALLMSFYIVFNSAAANAEPLDSTELQLQDIVFLLLGEPIATAVDDFYSAAYNIHPVVYPYEIELEQLRRPNGNRSYPFLITIVTTPVIGAHNSAGKDRITFAISPGPIIKLVNFEHIESYPLPPHLIH